MFKKFLIPALLLTACEIPPAHVELSKDVDQFVVRGSFASACVALDNEDNDDLRRYTARVLEQHPAELVANDCICNALYDAEAHTWDAAVADGIRGSKRDDFAVCLSGALTDAAIEDRDRAAVLLAGIGARDGFKALAEIAKTEPDAGVRAAAVRGLRGSGGYSDSLLSILKDDAEGEVRAAAAEALEGRDGKDVVKALVRAAKRDDDGGVRAAALSSTVKLKQLSTDELVCELMINDPDERVRDAAVRAFHGSKRPSSIDCLKERLLTLEESETVRASTLAALGASPRDEAALALCDSIGPFLRHYVKDKLQDDTPASNIIETQNNRDWDRSYDCVMKAKRQGGYSCYARHHLGVWVKKLGGNASTPWCPGMVKVAR
ncbi:MAG: HEAT repeat domain-containing protein [Proteobacteria bacterium]|nr:HEAT repeat domain-containing protein [Pseudomonadota bacterium]